MPGNSLGDSARAGLGGSPAGMTGGTAAASTAAGGASSGPGAGPRRARKPDRRRIAGTHYTRVRPLVRALRGCLWSIGTPHRRLLILRYGIAGHRPHSARQVARILDLSRVEYVAARRQALLGLVRAARQSSCGNPSRELVSTTRGAAAANAVGAFVRRAAGPGGEGGSRDSIAVLGESESSSDPVEPQREAGLGLLPDGGDDERFPWLAGLLLALAPAALLWFGAVRPRRAAAARERAYRRRLSGDDR